MGRALQRNNLKVPRPRRRQKTRGVGRRWVDLVAAPEWSEFPSMEQRCSFEDR